MKATETPEKIYINSNLEDRTWLIGKGDTSFIEYIRTDAFIEKACDAYCEVCGHYHHTVPYEICRHDCSYYDDFKNHLKGEYNEN